MLNRWLLIAVLVLVAGGGAALAQDRGDGTTVIDGQVTELSVITELAYGDTEYQIGPNDGTVAVGFVVSRATSTERSTLDVVLFVHDQTGWRSAGLLTGEATGPLSQAVAGDVLQLSVIGDGDD